MSDLSDLYGDESESPDVAETGARDHLRIFFKENRKGVFFSRQLEVQNEGEYFHWITNRAIRDLEDEGLIKSDGGIYPLALQ
ncbi:MAG TPA: hypothetical protein VF074_06075 [Pyrinomonadaceae bacterium]